MAFPRSSLGPVIIWTTLSSSSVAADQVAVMHSVCVCVLVAADAGIYRQALLLRAARREHASVTPPFLPSSQFAFTVGGDAG